ncbi:MAG: hypothetical protein HOA75_09040 [Deltaproteobacteria bacterium]|nr:hypothetical protein [Deltaproteobacteria bacterium]
MAPAVVSNATAVANPVDESFRRYDEAKIHPSYNRPVSSEGMGMRAVGRVIKTVRVLWQQIKHLPTMGYSTDLLKDYENFIPHVKH